MSNIREHERAVLTRDLPEKGFEAGDVGTVVSVHEGEAGTIHVESPDQRPFTLGEFFAVWGVKLTKNCIGMYCATSAKPVKWWVDGKPLTMNPADLVLRSHQEIVGVYGKPPAKIPKKWAFQTGE